MRNRSRSDDLSASYIKLREQSPQTGWRSLLQVRRSDLGRLLRSLPVILPLLAGVAVTSLSFVNMHLYRQQTVTTMELQAQRYALGVDRFFGSLRDDVDAAASALAAGNTAASEELAGASSARVIPLGPLGIADKDNSALEELRHIERDMLRRSVELQAPVLDAYRDGKEWELSIAQPVAGVGVLLASYPQQLLERELGRLASSEQVKTTLLFNVQGKWRRLVERGDFDTGIASAQASLSDPLWAVEVSLGEWAYERWIFRNLWLYVVLVIAAAAAFLQFGLALHRLRWRRLTSRRSAMRTAAEIAMANDREQDLLASAYSRALAESDSGPGDEAAVPGDSVDRRDPFDDALLADDDEFLDVLATPDEIPESSTRAPELSPADDFEHDIFRAYDIRGLAETQLTPALCRNIGLAVAAELKELRQSRVLVARDGRNSSPRIRDAIVDGLLSSGIDVTDLGAVPTPLMHFATHELGVGNGLMITGSHNGRECNGVKLVMAGRSLTEGDIHALRDRITEQRFSIVEGQRGRYDNKNIADRYVERVCEDVVVARRLKVVVDAANGITGLIAPRVYQALGCSVEPLYCELDGDFPNHDPDPTRPGNLHALQAAVRAKRADIGIAFDGDGDRVVFVTSTGDTVYPDQILMILAQDIVTRNPGATVVYDVKCSSSVQTVVSEAGGIPVMCRSGHSYVKQQVESSKALLGGEFTGHIFLGERWYGFDDGIYVGARMLELLSLSAKKLHQLLDTLPKSVSTPELLIETDERQKFVIIEQLKAGDYFAGAQLNTLDGIRAEFPYGWGLVRASNTGPALSLRFEADTQDNLGKIQAFFRRAINNVDPTLTVGF